MDKKWIKKKKKEICTWRQEAQQEPAVCTGSQEGKPCFGVL